VSATKKIFDFLWKGGIVILTIHTPNGKPIDTDFFIGFSGMIEWISEIRDIDITERISRYLTNIARTTRKYLTNIAKVVPDGYC